MDFLVSAMHKGGPFMWPILLFSLVGLVVPVGLGLLSLMGKRVPAVLWLLVPGTVLLTGLLGTVQGLDQVSEAIAHASLETKSTMGHAGMSVALFTQLSGAVFCAGLLVLAGWAAGLSGLRGGDGAKPSVLGAGAIAALVILGGLGCLGLAMTNPSNFFTIFLGLMLLPCGLFLALAALYSGGTEANRARLAENRLAATVCLVGSVGAAGIGVITQAQILVHEAYAYSSAETLSPMVSVGLGLAETGEMVLLAALIFALVAALIALVPVVRDLGNLRAAASMAGVLLGVLCWAGLAASVAGQMEGLSGIAKEGDVPPD
jgi:hypothetical protein